MNKENAKNKNRFAAFTFVGLSILFAICIVIQVFLAGLATFVDGLAWARHESFVHYFEFLPVLMLIFAFLGKLPRWTRWQSAGLFGLIFIMYFTANSRVILPWASAAHPVIALGLFWMSIQMVKKSIPFMKKVNE